MVDTLLRKMTKEGKQQARQQFILEKTLQLVLERGLDALSIANVCIVTELGAGQIYRCFKDKNDLLQQLLIYLTKKRILHFQQDQFNLSRKAKELASGNIHHLPAAELKLLIDSMFAAEKYHIQDVLQCSEEMLMTEGIRQLKQHFPHTSAAEIRAISEVLAVLSEGIMLRKANTFSHDANPEILEKIYFAFLTTLNDMFNAKPLN